MMKVEVVSIQNESEITTLAKMLLVRYRAWVIMDKRR